MRGLEHRVGTLIRVATVAMVMLVQGCGGGGGGDPVASGASSSVDTAAAISKQATAMSTESPATPMPSN